MAEAPRLMAPPRCPRCRIGSLLRDDDGLTCHACGYNWTPTPTVPLDKPERSVEMFALRCVVCGDAFRGKQATAKYCGSVCLQQAKRARGVLREVGA